MLDRRVDKPYANVLMENTMGRGAREYPVLRILGKPYILARRLFVLWSQLVVRVFM